MQIFFTATLFPLNINISETGVTLCIRMVNINSFKNKCKKDIKEKKLIIIYQTKK